MKHLLKPVAMLFCFVMASLTLSSFTAPQPRGGGDDEVIQLEYEVNWGNQTLNTGIPWILGDKVIIGAPYWVNVDNNGGDEGVLYLNVQANQSNFDRETSFHMTVMGDKAKYECDVHIVQTGRRN